MPGKAGIGRPLCVIPGLSATWPIRQKFNEIEKLKLLLVYVIRSWPKPSGVTPPLPSAPAVLAPSEPFQ
jgi:hypothetical protein